MNQSFIAIKLNSFVICDGNNLDTSLKLHLPSRLASWTYRSLVLGVSV